MVAMLGPAVQAITGGAPLVPRTPAGQLQLAPTQPRKPPIIPETQEDDIVDTPVSKRKAEQAVVQYGNGEEESSPAPSSKNKGVKGTSSKSKGGTSSKKSKK